MGPSRLGRVGEDQNQVDGGPRIHATLRPSIGGCETSPATRSATSPRATGRDRGAPYELKRDGRSVGATDSCTRSIAPAARSSA